jgi:hypothetical protein
MDILVFFFVTLSLGALCSVPAIIVGQLLAARGMVHEKPCWVILVVGISILFAWRLLFGVYLWLFLIIETVFLPLGIYRHDLGTYLMERKPPKQ